MRVGLLTIVLLLTLVCPVWAQDGPDVVARNKEAISLSQEGKLEEAIFVWLDLIDRTGRSYAHRWVFHKNVGRNYQKLDMLPEASWHLQRSLKLRGEPDEKASEWSKEVERGLSRKHARLRVYVQGEQGEVKVGTGKHARWLKAPFFWWFTLGEQVVEIRSRGVAPTKVTFRVVSEIEVVDLKPPTHGTLVVEVTPATAVISVGGSPVQKGTTELRLLAGRHELSAAAAGHEAVTETVTVTAGTTQTWSVELPVKVVIPEKPLPVPEKPATWWKWALLGGGGAMVVAGGVTFAMSAARLDDQRKGHLDWRIAEGLTGDLSSDESREVGADWDRRLADEVEPLQYTSYALWGAGSAAIIVASVFLYPDLFGGGDGSETSQVVLIPLLTQTSAGVGFEMTF